VNNGRRLIVLGFGGHARSVGDVALASGVIGLIFVDPQAKVNETFSGFPVFSSLPSDLGGEWFSFPAAGDNHARYRQCGELLFPLATLIAPDASIGRDADIDSGSFVGRQAHVGPLVKVGRGAILNSGSVVDHESTIGEFSHISVNATVAGRCRIGRYVFLGAGAVVIDGISVCDHVTIGAGSVVISDITESGTYVGSPARRL
jgi:sugar O-acyltransferase (sialic acid O-acetyltransferase NeuD family)